jgi:hypothetical protein
VSSGNAWKLRLYCEYFFLRREEGFELVGDGALQVFKAQHG